MEETTKFVDTPTTIYVTNQDEENNQSSLEKLKLTLPISTKESNIPNHLYQDFWCPSIYFQNVIAFQNHFQAQDTDIIIATNPKTGTTWLKSLVFCILNRNNFTSSNHPLLTQNPHELVPFFEVNIYSENNLIPDLSSMELPRLFSTHIPYKSLPASVKESKCKVICISRNPLDTFVSWWNFMSQIHQEFYQDKTMEEIVDIFCDGEVFFGPYWDHVLGYWNTSLEKPDKVLFIKYEDMKENGKSELKKLAEFVGCGFSLEEEKQGVIEDILDMCSLGNLMSMEVNKIGKFAPYMLDNKLFFRKGEVGDWANYLSSNMVEKLDRVMKEKFASTGLQFKM